MKGMGIINNFVVMGRVDVTLSYLVTSYDISFA